VTLLGLHAGEQAATALVLLATARGGLAAGGLGLAARRLAALLAEQAGRGFLILTHHCETNQGHQHGDRRQNNTIHFGNSSQRKGNNA
jgi:hypothetical protein